MTDLDTRPVKAANRKARRALLAEVRREIRTDETPRKVKYCSCDEPVVIRDELGARCFTCGKWLS